MKKQDLIEYIDSKSYKYNDHYTRYRAVNIKVTHNQNKVSDFNKALTLLFDESLSVEIWDRLRLIIDDYKIKLQEINSNLTFYVCGRSGGHLCIGYNKYPGRSLDFVDTEGLNYEQLRELYKMVRLLNELKNDMFAELESYIKGFDIKEETITIPKKINVLVEK